MLWWEYADAALVIIECGNLDRSARGASEAGKPRGAEQVSRSCCPTAFDRSQPAL